MTRNGFVSGSSLDKGLFTLLNASAPKPSLTSVAGGFETSAFFCDQYQKPAPLRIRARIAMPMINKLIFGLFSKVSFIMQLYHVLLGG